MTRWFGAMAVLAGMLVLAGVRLPLYAQDKEEKLEWKAFEKGKPFYQELTTKTTQDMKVMGQEISQKQEQTFFIKWTAEDKDKAGNYVVTQEIIGVKMKIDIGGNTIEYDSMNEKPAANPMSDFFKALLTMKLKLTINPKNFKVESIEGQDDFVKKLGGTNPQMEPLLNKILSKDALQQMAEPTWAAFPLEAVKKGSTWNKKSKLDLGPIGTYNTNFDFTFEGADKDKLDKVNIKSSLEYTAPSGKNGLPFVIKKATLVSKDGSGVAYIDRAKGRIEKSEMKMKLEGDLTIEVGGMETVVSLIQNQEAKVTTTDEDPVEKMKKKK
ncbi:MAG: DUF6263 family protein [Gemmataceae bacterium]|nr:DUF6263 family protein [Gemmataceae bacterium]MCI0738922.1 DUF6263 family protein [Gemmataceae bacterium]